MEMGALTDNAKKAARGYDSILEKGIFANHLEWFDDEYRFFPAKILEAWMTYDPDNRGEIDIPESEVFNDIAHRLKNYRYRHENRAAFQDFFARLIVLGATKKLCQRQGVDFLSAKVEMYNTDVSHLILDVAMHIVLNDKTIDAEELDMLYMSAVEQLSVEEIAQRKKCMPATVEEIVNRLSKCVIEVQEDLN